MAAHNCNCLPMVMKEEEDVKDDVEVETNLITLSDSIFTQGANVRLRRSEEEDGV